MYFTSDTHFFHSNIIKYCNRPFQDIDCMNEALIDNWNLVVGPKEEVYHLGDFSFGNAENTLLLLPRLNGRIHLIRGNHDYDKTLSLCWTKFASVNFYKELKYNKQLLVLCHYPIESWNKQRQGSIHLHGHCHGTLKQSPDLRRLDVGSDCFNFFPISITEISERMGKIPITGEDGRHR